MNKQQLRNLKKLPRVLRDEAERREKLGDRRMIGDNFRMLRFENSCGTPACVLGTYASRTDVQTAFKLVSAWRDRLGGIAAQRRGAPLLPHDGPEVCAHFGVSDFEAERLFGARGCNGARSEEDAARFIEAFIADKEAYPG